MKHTPENLKEMMQGKTDEELFDIVASHSWNYTKEVIEAALEEFKYRKLKTPNLLDFAASAENVRPAERWTRVKVPRNNYRFPTCCPGCLSSGPFTTLCLSSDKEKLKGFYLIVRHYEYLKVNVQFCLKCAARQSRVSRIGLLVIFLGIIASIAIDTWLDLSRLEGSLTFVVLCGPAFWFREYHGRTVRIAEYDEEYLTFSFKLRDFAQEFIKVNQV
jgi:hypothetical protein